MPKIRPVDRVEIISLVDNIIDQMTSVERKEVIRARHWVSGPSFDPHKLMATHGLSLLVRIYVDRDVQTIIYDTGSSGQVLLNNAEILNVSPKEIEAIAISHGHGDHAGGLLSLLENMEESVRVFMHPKSANKRRVRYETDAGTRYREMKPLFTFDEITRRGGELVLTNSPTFIANNTMLLSGEVPRITEYEGGFIGHEIQEGEKWYDDQKVVDDRFAVVHVKGKGIVILTGCSHSGIINIIKEATRISGVSKITAIIGGLHLAGRSNELRIKRTIRDLKKYNPNLIVPCHCTGWRAQCSMAREFGNSFISNGVGNLYRFIYNG